MALPALLKLAGVMEKGGQELCSCEQLPIEIELGQEFVYHSIFACPVSRDQSTAGGLRVASALRLCTACACVCMYKEG